MFNTLFGLIKNHQSSPLLILCMANSLHKGPIIRKASPCHEVTMDTNIYVDSGRRLIISPCEQFGLIMSCAMPDNFLRCYYMQLILKEFTEDRPQYVWRESYLFPRSFSLHIPQIAMLCKSSWNDISHYICLKHCLCWLQIPPETYYSLPICPTFSKFTLSGSTLLRYVHIPFRHWWTTCR